MTEPTQGQILKAIDRLVREGRAEHTLIDGKPGIRLIKLEPKMVTRFAFCELSFDGLGTNCARCGSWVRGRGRPTCPSYITRCEPDGARLPHIKSPAENAGAHSRWIKMLEDT